MISHTSYMYVCMYVYIYVYHYGGILCACLFTHCSLSSYKYLLPRSYITVTSDLNLTFSRVSLAPVCF